LASTGTLSVEGYEDEGYEGLEISVTGKKSGINLDFDDDDHTVEPGINLDFDADDAVDVDSDFSLADTRKILERAKQAEGLDPDHQTKINATLEAIRNLDQQEGKHGDAETQSEDDSQRQEGGRQGKGPKPKAKKAENTSDEQQCNPS
jgi:hypothetical protein